MLPLSVPLNYDDPCAEKPTKWEVNDKKPLFLYELEYILSECLVTLQAACSSYFI